MNGRFRGNRRPNFRGTGRLSSGQLTSLVAQLIAISGGRPIFSADRYIESAVRPGYVESFVDWNDPTHLLTQTLTASQIPIPTTTPGVLGGQPYVTFSNLTQSYVSNRASGTFSYMHNGSGSFQWTIFDEIAVSGFNNLGLATCDLTSAGNGAGQSLFHQNPNGFRVVVSNSSSYIANPTASGMLVTGSSYLTFQYQENASPEYQLKQRGTVIGSGSTTGAPSPGVPKTSLTLGVTTGINSNTWRWRATGLAPWLNQAQELTVRNYIQNSAGITPYLTFTEMKTLCSGRPVFTADNYVESGDYPGFVESFVDHNDPTHLLTQTDPAKMVGVPEAHADFNGQLCVTFTGAEYYESNRAASSWAFRSNGISTEEYAVFTPTQTTTASALNTLHDTTSGLTGFSGSILSYWGQTTNSCFASTANGAGVIGSATFGALTMQTSSYVGYASSSTSGYMGYNQSVATGITVTGGAVASPANTLRLGRRWSGVQPFYGRWAASFFGPELGGSRRLFQDAIENLYGLSAFKAVLGLAASRPVFTADNVVLDPASGKVLRFVDWNDPTHYLEQTDSTKQVAAPVAHSDFNGQKCATFTGVEFYVSNRAASYFKPWHDGTGASSVNTFFPTDTVTVATYYAAGTFNGSGPGFGNAYQPTTPAYVSLVRSGSVGSNAVIASTTGGAVSGGIYRFQYQESVSPEWSISGTGATSVTGSSATAPDTVNDPQNTLHLGARANSAGTPVGPAKMRWRHLVLGPYLTAQQIATQNAYFLADSGLAP